jgi:hypothetical protein
MSPAGLVSAGMAMVRIAGSPLGAMLAVMLSGSLWVDTVTAAADAGTRPAVPVVRFSR